MVHRRCTVPSSSVITASGSPSTAAAAHASPAGSGYRPKTGDSCTFVAFISRRRSSLGPAWVRSWGRTTRASYGSAPTTATSVLRVRWLPSGRSNSWVQAIITGSSCRRSTPRAVQSAMVAATVS